ncbi:hypothetical protein D3C86_818850 [compost metagenome]
MPTAMIMRGTTIGDSTKASMADLPRIFARTSRKAAGVPISIARSPVPTPTMSERVIACIHTGEVNICSYHCSEKPLGGHVSPEPESNDSGIIRKAGADRKASTSNTIHHKVRDWPVPDTERRRRLGSSANNASDTLASTVSTASPARRLRLSLPESRCRVEAPPVMVDRPSTLS